MWYDPKFRLPKRDKDNRDCSIEVLAIEENGNPFIGYIVYSNGTWWSTSLDGSAMKVIYQIVGWMYIPNLDTKALDLPIIDGE